MRKINEILNSNNLFRQKIETDTNKMEENRFLKETKAESKTIDSIDVSVIIPCKNEVTTLKETVDSIMKSDNSLSFEIIVVDDGSTDLSIEFLLSNLDKDVYKDVVLVRTNNIGAAQARNSGARIAKGKYLFFCDAHVKVPDRWLDDLVSTLKSFGGHLVAPCITDMFNVAAAGYGQTWDDHLKITWLTNKPKDIVEIPIACGCAFGITKEAFEKVNGFDNFFQVWGKEDEELCFKAWSYGYKILVNPEVKVQHLFRASHPYKVTAANVTYNMLCLAYSHFGRKRIYNTIQIAKNDLFFSTAVENIKSNSDLIFKQREKYLRERIYNDDFFFDKFSISF
ncbi:glycosyltransferase family 2 protein [Clostridium sp. DJ247]|uniref:glycosyltransferase family 2 protein n=1 Tax=Clostridium sp. DJ247 TaxID=2726188 RepID=UPI00162405C9|nr:glycosyltransferase [Clostridium sp. DJ247]MBC2580274.1 glycosyltransferase [Clostridium sp. DJ247]